MYVLVEYNLKNNLDLILNKLKFEKLNPIILFKINFNNKHQIKEDILKINNLKSKLKKNHFAILINLEKQENSFRNFINELKENFDLVIGQGGLNKENQFFCEQTKIDLLLNTQSTIKKPKIDFIHHFNSGLNQILAKQIKNKNIGLIFSLNNFENKYSIKEIGRINQNIQLSRKYKIPINLNFIINDINLIKSKIELNSILSLFKISTNQKKESFNLLKKIIDENQLKKSENYISKGILL